jgi:hypothetical protein
MREEGIDRDRIGTLLLLARPLPARRGVARINKILYQEVEVK